MSDPADQLSLWYRRPAVQWVEALPVGNGRLGGMVFGGVATERIQLNEESLWSGSPQDADNPEARAALPAIRALLFAGRYAEAQEQAYQRLVCRGPGSGGKGAELQFGSYQTLGDLTIASQLPEQVAGYRRDLDLDSALATTRFVAGGIAHRREVFASHPDGVLVVRVTADAPGALSCTVGLGRSERASIRVEGMDLVMAGRLADGLGGDGMAFVARARVLAEGGSIVAHEGTLRVVGASAVTILLAAGTDYRMELPTCRGELPDATVVQRIDAAAARSFVTLRQRHVEDHRRLFRRMSLDLGPAPDLPTDERLAAFQRGCADPQLAALYLQFGRYLLIASSRSGCLPANLQGIWCQDIQAPWNGDYHHNINDQMNYWLAETTNLGECFEPFARLIAFLAGPGARTARIHYGARGWTVHTISNVWGFTSPGEHPSWGLFPAAGAWLAQHLWEHYAFSGDRERLRAVYPLIADAARFMLDLLIEDPHGRLVTAPSNSPENNFRAADGTVAAVCYGPSMDLELAWDLFTNCAEAADVLGVDAELRAEVLRAREGLAPLQIGRHGQLQEWIEDFDEAEPHHRHTSHLFALHPGRQITDRTPALFAAARRSLERRGDAGTGWSMAWKICFWARLRDGDHAHRLLVNQLAPVLGDGLDYQHGGGTYPNLFDAHPPFQIDGNFGAAAGIAELLVQSHDQVVDLLPALPGAWPSGSVRGLRARGGLEVDIAWAGGRLVAATLRASLAGQCRVRHGDRTNGYDLTAGEVLQLDAELRRR